MNFYLYDLIFCAIFITFVSIFLYKRRKKIKIEKPFILYRTNFGIKLINKISKKDKILNPLEKIIIFFGYFLMVVGLFMLYWIIKIMVFSRDLYFGVIKMPPIFPLIPYFTDIFQVSILPPFYFTYWIIIIALATMSHEFFHGIFFRKEGVKIKSTGFAFLGPFLAAFVDLDEKKMNKIKNQKQLAAISAGTFANLLVGIIFVIISLIFMSFAFAPAGATFNTYGYSTMNVSSIDNITNNMILIDGIMFTEIKINDTTYFLTAQTLEQIEIDNVSIIPAFHNSPALRNKLMGSITEFDNIQIKSNKHLGEVLKNYSPRDNVTIKTFFNGSTTEYNITLIENPDNETKPYIGIASYVSTKNFIGKILTKVLPMEDYQPKFLPELSIFIKDLFFWIILINLSMAFFNMVPCSILDGGKFFYVSVLSLTKSKKIAEYSYKIISSLIIAILLFISLIWIFHFFS